ncbi:recombination protein RecR [Candidatus Parcubacteria bacterium]|nr:MAG: recombination protein RecR [Candidatus Parcubacteria bacterium]
MKLPDPIKKVVAELSELPSIGPRQAIRLAFYLVLKGKDRIRTLAREIGDLEKIKTCERCFFIHQNTGSLCDTCESPSRRKDLIMIVEKETDLISLENTGKFGGRYFIVGIIPKTGLLEDWQKLRIQNLKSFIQKELGGQAEEIIFAFNPSTAGDFNASLITKELRSLAKKISRLGRGLPTGGEIEFADDETLGASLERRS